MSAYLLSQVLWKPVEREKIFIPLSNRRCREAASCDSRVWGPTPHRRRTEREVRNTRGCEPCWHTLVGRRYAGDNRCAKRGKPQSISGRAKGAGAMEEQTEHAGQVERMAVLPFLKQVARDIPDKIGNTSVFAIRGCGGLSRSQCGISGGHAGHAVLIQRLCCIYVCEHDVVVGCETSASDGRNLRGVTSDPANQGASWVERCITRPWRWGPPPSRRRGGQGRGTRGPTCA